MLDVLLISLDVLFSCECDAILRCCLCSVCGHRVSLCKLGGVDFEIHQKSSQEGRLGCTADMTCTFLNYSVRLNLVVLNLNLPKLSVKVFYSILKTCFKTPTFL